MLYTKQDDSQLTTISLFGRLVTVYKTARETWDDLRLVEVFRQKEKEFRGLRVYICLRLGELFGVFRSEMIRSTYVQRVQLSLHIVISFQAAVAFRGFRIWTLHINSWLIMKL